MFWCHEEVMIGTAGRLVGHFYIHNGDNSGFVCERSLLARRRAAGLAGFQGPAQPSATLGDAINAGFGYLEVKCLGCNTHQTEASAHRRKRMRGVNACE